MTSEWRVPISNLASSVMRETLPSPRGRPSSASTAMGELQGVSFSLCCWTNSSDTKLPAAPESINAVVEITLSWIIILTGSLMLDGEVVTWSLTDRELVDGRTGQEIFRLSIWMATQWIHSNSSPHLDRPIPTVTPDSNLSGTKSFSVSSTQLVWAARVRKDRAYSAAGFSSLRES